MENNGKKKMRKIEMRGKIKNAGKLENMKEKLKGKQVDNFFKGGTSLQCTSPGSANAFIVLLQTTKNFSTHNKSLICLFVNPTSFPY